MFKADNAGESVGNVEKEQADTPVLMIRSCSWCYADVIIAKVENVNLTCVPASALKSFSFVCLGEIIYSDIF